jgi:leader peptidase (prepilin peptidase)/N-methyltransferase
MPEFVLWIYAGVVGACVGSFLNVVIYRLPRGQSIVRPRSACAACTTPIAPYDNVPLFSWLLLRGRCRHCQSRISVRYLLVELATALLALACLAHFGPNWRALAMFALLAALLAVACIDWEHMIIPDSISLGALVLGLCLSPWIGPGLIPALLGASVGGGLLLIVALLWEKLRGVEAMGGGDIKLMAAVGAFLGMVPTLLAIFLGSFLGAFVGAVLLSRSGQAKIAFGTFLAAATGLVVFFGDSALAWYLRWAGFAS